MALLTSTAHKRGIRARHLGELCGGLQLESAATGMILDAVVLIDAAVGKAAIIGRQLLFASPSLSANPTPRVGRRQRRQAEARLNAAPDAAKL